MRTRFRDVSKNYRALRHQPDELFNSRLMSTLFNKFIKKGRKSVSRRLIFYALRRLRLVIRRPRTFTMLIRALQDLHIPILLVPLRQGKQFNDVPVPVRRNKKDTISIQTLANAIVRRKELQFTERWREELVDLTINYDNSSTIRQRSAHLAKVYEERVNMEKRWR